ncbi:MAG: thiamine phosphate synthase [Gammaproteobacteria bacterium]
MENHINIVNDDPLKENIPAIAITPNLDNSPESISDYIIKLSKYPIKTLVVRNKLLSPEEFISLFKNIHAEIKNLMSIDLYANCSEDTFGEIKDLADGIHLTSDRLMSLNKKKYNKSYGASCHNIEEILTANKLLFDYCFLGPVKKNIYKKKFIGWNKFNEMSLASDIRVYALGGLTLNDLPDALDNNADGIASISTFTN